MASRLDDVFHTVHRRTIGITAEGKDIRRGQFDEVFKFVRTAVGIVDQARHTANKLPLEVQILDRIGIGSKPRSTGIGLHDINKGVKAANGRERTFFIVIRDVLVALSVKRLEAIPPMPSNWFSSNKYVA